MRVGNTRERFAPYAVVATGARAAADPPGNLDEEEGGMSDVTSQRDSAWAKLGEIASWCGEEIDKAFEGMSKVPPDKPGEGIWRMAEVEWYKGRVSLLMEMRRRFYSGEKK